MFCTNLLEYDYYYLFFAYQPFPYKRQWLRNIIMWKPASQRRGRGRRRSPCRPGCLTLIYNMIRNEERGSKLIRTIKVNVPLMITDIPSCCCNIQQIKQIPVRVVHSLLSLYKMDECCLATIHTHTHTHTHTHQGVILSSAPMSVAFTQKDVWNHIALELARLFFSVWISFGSVLLCLSRVAWARK